jgi:hypothetical protein
MIFLFTMLTSIVFALGGLWVASAGEAVLGSYMMGTAVGYALIPGFLWVLETLTERTLYDPAWARWSLVGVGLATLMSVVTFVSVIA